MACRLWTLVGCLWAASGQVLGRLMRTSCCCWSVVCEGTSEKAQAGATPAPPPRISELGLRAVSLRSAHLLAIVSPPSGPQTRAGESDTNYATGTLWRTRACERHRAHAAAELGLDQGWARGRSGDGCQQFAAKVRGGPEGFQVEQRAATGAAFNGLTRAVKGRFEQYDPSGPRGSRECPEQPQAELRQIPPQSGPSHPACARRPLAPSARGAIYI